MATCVYSPSTETAETSGSPELTSSVKDPFQEIIWKAPEKNTQGCPLTFTDFYAYLATHVCTPAYVYVQHTCMRAHTNVHRHTHTHTLEILSVKGLKEGLDIIEHSKSVLPYFL